MPVTLSNIAINPKFTDEFTGSGGGGIDYPIGAILDKITVDLQVDIAWQTVPIPCVFDSATKTITRNDVYNFPHVVAPVAVPPPGVSFLQDGFKNGDTITVSGSLSNDGVYHIDTVTMGVITTVEALVNETVATPLVTIYGDTPVTAIDFLYNLIENSSPENYVSLTDNSTTNKYNLSGLSTAMTITSMNPVGASRGGVFGSCQITGMGTVNHVQSYLFTQVLYITPAFLANWLTNIQGSINPQGFYDDIQSLKYIAKVNAKFDNTQETPPHTSDFFTSFKSGNIGFYDEFLNGYDVNYFLKSIVFTDVTTGDPVGNLQYGRSTDVEIRLTSVNNAFSAGCKIVLNQLYCPLTESDYVNTGALTMDKNFRWDRLMLTEGGAPANGSQFGTDYQSITGAQAILISAAELKIIYRCTLASAYNIFINGKDPLNRNYLISATPQDLSVTTTAGTDRNAIICHTDNYTTDKTDASLWEITGGSIFFHQYPDEVVNDYTDFKGFSGDFCLVNGNFKVKSLSDVILKTLTFKIEATKLYSNNIVLEEFSFDVSAFAPCDDMIQRIDIEQPTNFKVDPDSAYAYISLYRNEAYDTGNYINYYFEYPFRVRYETWIALLNAACMNGTQDWASYQEAGWSIKFNIYASVYDNVNANQTDFLHESNLSFNEFDSGVTIMRCLISTTDITETERLDGMILADADTVVIATINGDFSVLPSWATGRFGMLTLDSPQVGGVAFSQYISTEEDVADDNIWKGYGATSRAQLTVVNNETITIKAIIDYVKLQNLSLGQFPLDQLMIYAKVGPIVDQKLILQEDSTSFSFLLQENLDGISQE